MLFGATSLTLDAKGRMAMPARFRDLLAETSGGEVIVTVDWKDRCLLIYPMPEWKTVHQKLMELPSFKDQTRHVQRLMMGYATAATLDSHGRILLTPTLREYAFIDRDVMLFGQGNKFELWSSELWRKQCDDWSKRDHGKEGLEPEIAGLSI